MTGTPQDAAGWERIMAGEVPFAPPPMDLRDWFAGQALAGMMTCRGAAPVKNNMRIEDALAGQAYLLAEAMLRARVEGHQP